MNFLKLTLVSSLFFLVTGCYTSNASGSKKDTSRDIQYTSLGQILRGKPSLKITGSGEDLTVIIRGERSFFDNNEPLFMLDDVVIGNSFKEAVAGIDPTGVSSADVITPANAGRFGARGGNGVIVFRSKRNR